MLSETLVKEDISISYILALCAYAGIAYETTRHDEDSTDGTLRKLVQIEGGRKFNAELRIQLKCTSSSSQYTDYGEYITYKLKAKNYNDLCSEGSTDIILGLLVLPEDQEQWIHWSKEELLTRGCMYWANLSNEPETDNSSTVSVKIDKKHVINAETLDEILGKIARGNGNDIFC